MKKFLLVIAGLFVLLAAAAVVLPIIYKDDIRALIDRKIAESVNADVKFSPEKFDLTLFKDFPNLTLTVGDLAVINQAPFAGDTLTFIPEAQLEINLFEVISGGNVSIEGIRLTQPYVHVKVLPDGRANWDIAKPDTTQQPEEESASDMKIKIKEWTVSQGHIVYDDQSLTFFMELDKFDHEGNGDFTLDNFDLRTLSKAEVFTVGYGGLNYLNRTKLDADLTLNMDLPSMTFTFRDNKATINAFTIGADGFFKMPANGYEMDLKFDAKETEFKNILSLVPGVFMQGFEDLKTSGKVAFNGSVKGLYNEASMPALQFALKVEEGMFQYPKLPTAVNNIFVDMALDLPASGMKDLLFELKSFRMDLGANPVKGLFSLKGFPSSFINADVDARFNLADVDKMFPVEGLDMSGMYSLALKANGVYDTIAKTIPQIDAKMKLENGFVKTSQAPVPLEDLHVNAEVLNTTGKMADTRVLVEQLRMKMDGEAFEAKATAQNLEDVQYEASVKGIINLDLIRKMNMMPQGMDVSGKIAADITTKGRQSDAMAGRYDRLPTSGKATLTNFAFSSPDMPQGAKISEAVMTFTPQALNLEKFDGMLGKSDLQLSGQISNYLGFALHPDQVLKGNLKLNSKQFDANEWMTDAAPASSPDTSKLSVIPIPKNVDFAFDAFIGKLLYNKLAINEFDGNMRVKDGILSLTGMTFNMLGGRFGMSGNYNTADPAKPKFDYDLSIDKLSFSDAVTAFGGNGGSQKRMSDKLPASVQPIVSGLTAAVSVLQGVGNAATKAAPIAQDVKGNFSTKFKISGLLGQDMMPVLSSLTGGGTLNIVEAALENVKALNKVGELTNIRELVNPRLQDVTAAGEFKDGRLNVRPFDLRLAGFVANVGGSTGFDGTMDYKVKMDVPAERLNAGLAAQYTSLTGKTTVPVEFDLRGTYQSPNVAMGKDAMADALKARAAEVKQEVKQEIKDAAKDAAKDVIGGLLNPQDTTKKKPEDAAKDKANQLKDALKDKIKWPK